MKSLGIAIKKGEIWYSFIEGTDRNVAIISETGKQNFRPESYTLMMDFNNIFTELITKFMPDVVSYKLSLDINMKQIPYMHYSIGVLNLLCLQKVLQYMNVQVVGLLRTKGQKYSFLNNISPIAVIRTKNLRLR